MAGVHIDGMKEFGDVEVRVGRALTAQADHLVAGLQVGRTAIGIRMHTHTTQPQLPGCARHAGHDLATIGDEHAVKGLEAT